MRVGEESLSSLLESSARIESRDAERSREGGRMDRRALALHAREGLARFGIGPVEEELVYDDPAEAQARTAGDGGRKAFWVM